jgi:hypothetical protein
MNIFILSYDPVEAAQMQCDQHVVKMPLEMAQMLCTAYPEKLAPYARTHFNHPCNIWLRESKANFEWGLIHGLALCDEYGHRYGKTHACEKIIFWCWAHMELIEFSQEVSTPHPVAMDDNFKLDTVIESYRNFYIEDKSRFAKWTKSRAAPNWYEEKMLRPNTHKTTGDLYGRL